MSSTITALTTEMSGFGDWMKHRRAELEQQGVSLSNREIGRRINRTHVQVGKIQSGESGTTKAIVDAIADALCLPTATEEEREQLRNEARAAAAGIDLEDLQGLGGKVVRSFDPDDPRVRFLDAADDLSLEYIESIAQQAEVAAREFRKLNPRTGTFGKRARDDEE